MSSLERSKGGAVAAGISDNHAAKKRRRWSTAQEDVVVPNRFGGKNQMRILGRHHTSSSVNSLLPFQSKLNPIFEPSAPSYSSNKSEIPWEGLRQGAARSFQFQWEKLPTDASTTAWSRGAAEKPHPSVRRSAATKTSSQSSALTNCGGPEDDDMEKSRPLLQSQTSYGADAHWTSEESRETSRNHSEETWHVEEPPNQIGRLPPVCPVPGSSDDGALSIDGPRCLDDVSEQEEEELASIKSCERRSRELVEKVQANAAAELAQLKAYKVMIDQLRVDCANHEADAKQYAELHRDAVVQLLSARDENRELRRERGAETVTKEEFRKKHGIADGKEVANRDWKLKLGAMEKERDGWRKKAETLEMDLMAVRSDRDAIAIANTDGGKESEAEGDATMQDEEKKIEMVGDAVMTIRSGVSYRAVDFSRLEADNGECEVVSKIVLEPATAFSKKLVEVEAQLAAVCDEMDKLQRERNELRIAVLNGEKRVEEAEKERDAVVLTVQREWDAVKVALREDKEKLVLELEAVREQKTELEIEIGAKNKMLEGERHQIRRLEDEPDAMAAAMREALQKIEEGREALQISASERDGSLTAVRDENRKLETELGVVRDHNKKLESEREALLAALNGVRNGNKKLEGELSAVRDEKTKLEKEREALIAVREERQKLEGERAVVCKAMRGQNKKLESEREVLIAMQAYLKKLEMKKDLQHTLGGGGREEAAEKQAGS